MRQHLAQTRRPLFYQKGSVLGINLLCSATAGAWLVKGEAVWVAKTLPQMLQSVGV